jgi:adenine-specific DNA-methyltransferase
MFFTIDNANRIDYIHARIEALDLNDSDRMFLQASLIVSADSVSNVPAVYGCYLKAFKAKATAPLVLIPIHTSTTPPAPGSRMLNQDILTPTDIVFDAVYVDPPYNQRQYSKNYFPLNVIAMSSDQQSTLAPTGKTGIPQNCFLSPFCQVKRVEDAFRKMMSSLQSEWVFVSYSSEGLISKDTLTSILSEFGEVTLHEREYKRFKSFDYNADGTVQEFFFCVRTPAR